MSRSDLLFYGKDLSALIRGYEAKLKEEVEQWERNRILASSESDLITYLVKKYTLDPPRLLRDQIHIDSEGETKIDISRRYEYDVRNRNSPYLIPGSYVTVAIPFEGDGDLFEFQASAYNTNPPRGRVSGLERLDLFPGCKIRCSAFTRRNQFHSYAY